MRADIRRLPAGAVLLCLVVLGGCEASGTAPGGVPGDAGDTQPFAGIGANEAVNAAGTEPFWNLRVENGTLTYTTPENMDGEAIGVERFAGRGGLSFSGLIGERTLDLAITPGTCNDGMSDRTYPFHATLALGDEQRSGCAWRDSDDLGPPP